MQEKLAWLKRHGENLRRTLMLEPRGHSGMHGALLTEPSSPSAHAGLLTMHAGGFSAVASADTTADNWSVPRQFGGPPIVISSPPARQATCSHAGAGL